MAHHSDIEKFLQVFFGTDNPTDVIFTNLKPSFHTRNWRKLDQDIDCYLTPGRFAPEATTNVGAEALEVAALVLDDVGTAGIDVFSGKPISRIAPEQARQLGAESGIIRTSEDNHHYWFKLSRPVLKGEWKRFRQVVDGIIGIKSHSSASSALFRAPFGRNVKRGNAVEVIKLVDGDVLDVDVMLAGYTGSEQAQTRSPDAKCRDMVWLAHITPNNEQYDDREPWVNQAFRFKALALDEQDGFAGFVVWSKKHKDYNEHDTIRLWEKLGDVTGTDGGLLIKAAWEAAPDWLDVWWQRQAAEYFNDGVEHPIGSEVSKAKQLVPHVLTSGEFVADFIPPDYLVKKLITKAFLYSLTGQTGAGKTSITLRLAATVAQGASFGGLGTKPCRVLYLAAENPVDIQMRWIALAAEMGFDVNMVAVFFVRGWFKIGATMKELRAEASRIGGEFGLIVVDTGPVFFEGEDENDRVAMRKHARMMRDLIEAIPGKPAVIVNVHPVKNAGLDNLLPSGGGSFLNEVDGNLTCAKNEDQTIELNWQGKWRGVEFAPLHFLLRTVTHSRILDSDGEEMPTVVCEHLTMSAKEDLERTEFADQDKLLAEMTRNPRASAVELAIYMDWHYPFSGQPAKSKVQRYVKKLIKEKRVKKHLQLWVVLGAKSNGSDRTGPDLIKKADPKKH